MPKKQKIYRPPPKRTYEIPASYFTEVTFDQKIKDHLRLCVASLVDRKTWKIEAVKSGSSISGFFLSLDSSGFVPSPEYGPIRKRSFIVTPLNISPKRKWEDEVPSPQCLTYKEPLPSPYTVTVEVMRSPPLGRTVMIGEWKFYGECKPGESLFFRTDAMLDMCMEDNTTPYVIEVFITVRSKCDKTLELCNPGSALLQIGEKRWKYASKEALALHSPYFYNLYYGGFSETPALSTVSWERAKELAVKMFPGENIDVQRSDMALRLLLDCVQRKQIAAITPFNAHLVVDLAHRFNFHKMIESIDRQIVRCCRRTDDREVWDEAVILLQSCYLPKTAKEAFDLYSNEELFDLVDRQKHRMNMSLLYLIFREYKEATLNAQFRRCCHVAFTFKSGVVIVQLHRAGMPNTIAKLMDKINQGVSFSWDKYKNRLVSEQEFGDRFFCEPADKHTVPEGTWALLARTMRDYSTRLVLTKDRTHKPSTYLGFAVTGAHILESRPSFRTVREHKL